MISGSDLEWAHEAACDMFMDTCTVCASFGYPYCIHQSIKLQLNGNGTRNASYSADPILPLDAVLVLLFHFRFIFPFLFRHFLLACRARDSLGIIINPLSFCL